MSPSGRFNIGMIKLPLLSSRRQQMPSLGRVGGDLRLQRVQPGEPYLWPDIRDECHDYLGPVNVAAKVEQIDLQPALGPRVHRWTAADIGHAVVHRAIRQPHGDRVNPARWLQMPAERDIRGWKSDRPASFVAVRHFAADGPGAAEFGGRALGVAVL